ncbi:MAG TPA: Ig-like domain-containing protein, partial [Bacteroidia bacterium]|nr:Ig-like domain-containing protein [Bacteroidia bacterium]
MKTILLRALVTMLLLAPTALFSQNLPTVAVNDTVYMCGSTVTIYVQSNDTNPDGDSLTLSIYAGSVNGSFTINGNAIDYTPNVGFVGTDTLVYVVCDDGTPELCDTAFVFIHVYAFYIENNTATICNGDSVFLEGAYQTAPGLYTDFFTTIYGCDSIIITTLIVNPPTISTISADGPTTFCDGDSVTLTASPGTGWIWSTGDTTQSITVDSSGTYFVIVSDTNGCSASSALITVTESTTITASITPNGPTTFCEGDSVMLIASSGTSWLWSTGDTTQSITVDSSGTYSVTVNNGACTATASATVTVNPSPVATITPGGPTTFCEGGSVTLTASNGNSWLWSTGETSQEITADTSGFY